LLKNRSAPLSQPAQPTEAASQEDASQEDAWLNDVGPLSLPESATECEPEVTLVRQAKPEENPPTEDFSAEQIPVSIGPDHRLWPLVLALSERIWYELHQKPDLTSVAETVLVKFVHKRAIDILRTEPVLVQQVGDVTQAELLLQGITTEVLGYGPLEALLKDESISKIIVLGPHLTSIERDKKVEDIVCSFADDRHILRIVENMLRRAGRRLVPGWPIVDMRLPDGSLVNVVLPPSAINGPAITIRKGPKKPLTMSDLLASGTLTEEMADFFNACIHARLNILICGGIDSGRTTLLNALSMYIPADERIATIEEVAELKLSQKHVIALVSQLASPGSVSNVTLRDLVINALRTGSERILLGECRGDEVEEMIQAMNNGYSGALMTIYARDVRNCLARLEMLYQAANTALPLTLLRAQLATALDVIVHIARLRDGSHRIVNIAEVQSVENNTIKLQSIFHFQDAGFDKLSGQFKSSFEPSGFAPTFLSKFEAMGLHFSPEMFQPKNM
ncbi:MAG TPA: ATPase, T2SS/T4P/T4SS family, partial [Ktedonobacteraceae bacterium]|nr:ATPase, T2SS/T4P/T4SS family [Ktedonobacteraceae bacterium]